MGLSKFERDKIDDWSDNMAHEIRFCSFMCIGIIFYLIYKGLT